VGGAHNLDPDEVSMAVSFPSLEHKRLHDAQAGHVPWRKWGPYLSERQWGTVREDYSTDGNAWEYFSHDQARSRAYHWGEDGLAGISDEKQRLCFALALWNGHDRILKERLFGLTNSEGNHGEDVKEYYFYLDNTPTHSYMKYLYKYPQRAFPYEELIARSRERTRYDMEYELIDTGIFDEDRYFDVLVEYAKVNPEELLIQISVRNCGPEAAIVRVLPTLWFRNTWAWAPNTKKPYLEQGYANDGTPGVLASHPELGQIQLYAERDPAILFTDNETNNWRLFQQVNASPFVKDGINDYVVEGRSNTISPEGVGTKCAVDYELKIPGGEREVLRLRLLAPERGSSDNPHKFFKHEFSSILNARKQEADDFYAAITPPQLDKDARSVMRQSLAGMLWSKQYYFFDLQQWLREHNVSPGQSSGIRNRHWFHMLNDDIISMPDKWEYPWYAAWDLAFHTLALLMVDPQLAKRQLELMFASLYLHPSGQIPAYEWNFGDVNPPVHAWAALSLYNQEKELSGKGDVDFLKRAFDKLLFNFSWWVNRKDPEGRNVFEGGFLGLDNIGVFDRSVRLPTGGTLEQADGTAWMAFFCQNMLEIALELSNFHDSYQAVATKFCEHFLWIASAMNRMGDNADELWDEEDGFFYDLLMFPDGNACRLKVRSMVGLLPLCAATVLYPRPGIAHPEFIADIRRFLDRNSDLTVNIAPPEKKGFEGRHLLAILNEDNLRRVLRYMLDENEFLSDFGIRSLSRYHLDHPYIFHAGGQEFRVDYQPAESNSGLFGGNSNWRGPIWFPVNMLLLRALLNYYLFYGDDFKVECPTGSGVHMTLFEVAQEINRRLCSIFLCDEAHDGRRPVYGGNERFQTDPLWRDHILFYEYFHGDNGAGIGASHQTGWTGLVARLLQLSVGLNATQLLNMQSKPVLASERLAA
jgi:mannosylglycerate hydrolase MGH1-like protein